MGGKANLPRLTDQPARTSDRFSILHLIFILLGVMLPVVVSRGSGGSPEFKPPCFTRSTLVSPDDQDGPSFLCGAVPEPLVYSLVLATPCPRGGSSASAHTGFFAAILLFFFNLRSATETRLRPVQKTPSTPQFRQGTRRHPPGQVESGVPGARREAAGDRLRDVPLPRTVSKVKRLKI